MVYWSLRTAMQWGQDADCLRACCHNYMDKVIVLVLLLDLYSQAPESHQSATVDACCRQCIGGGFSSQRLFFLLVASKGCCCKSCVIHKKQVLLSARLHLRKSQRCTNTVDLGPQPLPPWIFFLFTSVSARGCSCLHSSLFLALLLLPSPPFVFISTLPLPLHRAAEVVFSLTVLHHGKYLASDAFGRFLSGHVSLISFPAFCQLSPPPRSVRTEVGCPWRRGRVCWVTL